MEADLALFQAGAFPWGGTFRPHGRPWADQQCPKASPSGRLWSAGEDAPFLPEKASCLYQPLRTGSQDPSGHTGFETSLVIHFISVLPE